MHIYSIYPLLWTYDNTKFWKKEKKKLFQDSSTMVVSIPYILWIDSLSYVSVFSVLVVIVIIKIKPRTACNCFWKMFGLCRFPFLKHCTYILGWKPAPYRVGVLWWNTNKLHFYEFIKWILKNSARSKRHRFEILRCINKKKKKRAFDFRINCI